MTYGMLYIRITFSLLYCFSIFVWTVADEPGHPPTHFWAACLAADELVPLGQVGQAAAHGVQADTRSDCQILSFEKPWWALLLEGNSNCRACDHDKYIRTKYSANLPSIKEQRKGHHWILARCFPWLGRVKRDSWCLAPISTWKLSGVWTRSRWRTTSGWKRKVNGKG